MAQTILSAKHLRAEAVKLDRPVLKEQSKLLTAYLEQLIKWNKKMNLVGKSDWITVFKTLVVDSLHLADFLADNGLDKAGLTLDLGAGAGLPGIPLRCLWQEGEYQLVEVREKRTLFMRSVVGKLQLPGTHVFHGRAEDVIDHLEKEMPGIRADLILSRAFMPWLKLLDFVRPMLAEGGSLVVLANGPAPSEEEMPEGWQVAGESEYKAGGKRRCFWHITMKST